jgi:hypothetical protein
MNDQRLVRIDPQTPVHGGMAHMRSAIASTTNVTQLVTTVVEAYKLTVSLERDIVEIKAYYANLEATNRQLHSEIMAALEGRFTERAQQVAFVERIASQLIEQRQFETAHSIVTQLMKLLQQSPVDEAFGKRR